MVDLFPVRALAHWSEKKAVFRGYPDLPGVLGEAIRIVRQKFFGRYPSRTGLAAAVSGSTTTAVP